MLCVLVHVVFDVARIHRAGGVVPYSHLLLQNSKNRIMKKLPHELTNEELLLIKALKQRRKVSTGDAPMLNSIYGRMTPGYEICSTCIETLGAEAISLIAYAEKQIGGPILNYTSDEGNDAQIEETSKIGTKEVQILGEHFDRPARMTVTVPNDFVEGTPIEITEKMIVGVEYIANDVPKGDDVPADTDTQGPGATHTSIVDDETGIDFAKLSNAEIVAYVFKETEIELSENADREELLESAIDILANFVDESIKKIVAKKVDLKLDEKVELHKNGLTATKGAVIYAYVKQETGIELQPKLKRPILLKAAAEALEKSGE
jgi:hypothetical protein